MEENIDLLIPYIGITDIFNVMFTSSKTADAITRYFYSYNGWVVDNDRVGRIRRVVWRYKCKYCTLMSLTEQCPKHWCGSCNDYRPIFMCNEEALSRKYPYICQKCSKCESCPRGARRLRYVNTTEYGTNCTLLAMVICDRCIRACASCGSPNNYLCIGTDGSKLSRCANCINMEDVNSGKVMLIKNFTID
jgi:hypothetical protein